MIIRIVKGFLSSLLVIAVCLFSTLSCDLSRTGGPVARGISIVNGKEVTYDNVTYYGFFDPTGLWHYDKSKMEYVGITDPETPSMVEYVYVYRGKGGEVSAVLLETSVIESRIMYCSSVINWYDFLTAEFSSGTVCGGNGSSIYDFDCKRLEEIADVSACLPVSDTFIPHESGLELRLILKDADCISCVFPILESDGNWFIGVKERYYLLIENEELTAALSQRQIVFSR